MSTVGFSEDKYVKILDRALYDSLVKFSAGTVVGGLASLLFLKRRRWPLIAGAGFGLGVAYSHLEHELNQSFNPRKSL